MPSTDATLTDTLAATRLTAPLRTATVADVVNRLRSSGYPLAAVDALGWGMGDAQYGIEAAVAVAVKAGVVEVSKLRGKPMVALTAWGRDGYEPQPMFRLMYRTSNGPVERVLPANGIERIGAVVMRLADRDKATDIEVRDENGSECTFDFRCFT
jgi:hypothetical protein